MVKLSLLIKADLDHLAFIAPDADTRFYIKTACSNCGEKSEKFQYISTEDTFLTPNGKVAKCKACKRDHNIEILPPFKRYTADHSGSFSPIATFECRGVDIVEYEPRAGFSAEGEKGTSFEVDLAAGDWSDYDEKTSESVGIYEFSHKFEVTK
ncbi:hypothetical protein PROFUN_05719 [Planoprotostelium fungivorum]|uniref:Uncharacterized protein n=1 Tax=Planoprotostelium fungivorum TaxID=1890364 RepID=A0A2P6NQG9_9EUKA|nr:hypothetical protein PROFUN_05719 [Planoprotostelium fungivorum]